MPVYSQSHLGLFNAAQGELNIAIQTVLSSSIEVPWFPTKLYDVNYLGKTLHEEHTKYNQDHPQFTDLVYRKRRDKIAQIAKTYKIQDKIFDLTYSED